MSFRYRDEVLRGEPARLEYGLVAEEVADVAPELVVRNALGEPEAVRYQLLAPLLVGDAQRQERAIAALERRIEELEARLREQCDGSEEKGSGR